MIVIIGIRNLVWKLMLDSLNRMHNAGEIFVAICFPSNQMPVLVPISNSLQGVVSYHSFSSHLVNRKGKKEEEKRSNGQSCHTGLIKVRRN